METKNDLVQKGVMGTRSEWMNIAFDIAMSLAPNVGQRITPEQICAAYNMTPETVVAMFELPEFANMVRDARKRVAAMGDNAAMQLQAQILASDMQSRIYNRLILDTADTKDMMRFYERLMSYGLLDPNTNGSNKQKSEGGAGGGNVTIVNMHVPKGIAGLDHIYNSNQPIIEAEVTDNE